MTTMRPFQIGLITFFGLLALAGIAYLAGYKGGGDTEKPYGEGVEIWGTLSSQVFTEIFSELSPTDEEIRLLSYREFTEDQFDAELIDAIAEDRSPDLIILNSESLAKYRSKLIPLVVPGIDARSFRDKYIDGAEIFNRAEGIYGLPLVVDPLVMFWNRDMLSSSGLSAPPTTWETLVSVTTPALSRVSSNRDIAQSAVAFGEYNNVTHAKEVLSMLILQAGSEIVTETNGIYQITLNTRDDNSRAPGAAALAFYTQFALPNNTSYTWGRSLPNDYKQFLSRDLGLYFGFASEIDDTERQNPNLNFDVARVPQGDGATVLRNFGRFYAFAVPRAAQGNSKAALNAAQKLGSPEIVAKLSAKLGLAPAHRSLIGKGGGIYQPIVDQSGLIARGWMDPDPLRSEGVFKQMIEDVISGRRREIEASEDAGNRLQLLF